MFVYVCMGAEISGFMPHCLADCLSGVLGKLYVGMTIALPWFPINSCREISDEMNNSLLDDYMPKKTNLPSFKRCFYFP